ncbi:hypothetical protein A3I36_04720 [Candidatus Giovannonibacteria bacterium RIFCSPLOWO2_02_FULL_45_28]|uniref:Uncharacterized protein n=2 Tax=Candidatus Giovannoniibacteriota TaxID=1752738 RepID=A0A1F5WB14_9BACT|nr:MAG: hypothetical protein UW15_C0020G0008 [Parcubacteria group bacterium GW2011_GWC1_44_10]KKT59416.1 MAG: hypothetical protein UW53_C0013G0017 [Candidatus Giovannonibacteria bacterium GW2011_GWA1_44_25]KKU29533.1 MAG: hypothetical protein UX43_C0010G0017 [Candidatus Giovannonibacteria bacterium GW2011_GWB1_46_20]OGF49112.1 MAG: hypothetical protein A2120_04845 [Candidatus Giovannonibacteria bacterium GWA2_45_15]OGF60550.1 MAG: hypothetical protein A2W40_02965 [Candidatus Giovannonibacteria 
MNKTLRKIAIISTSILPLVALAATTVQGVLIQIRVILNQVVPIIMVLATIVFLWGVIRYVTAGGDEEKIKEGKQFIIFGLIGLFIMVAVWGIIASLQGTFGLGTEPVPPGPATNF